jgi:hypothetical protein
MNSSTQHLNKEEVDHFCPNCVENVTYSEEPVPKKLWPKVVKKSGPNQGRHFLACPTEDCKFFTWLDGGGNAHGNASGNNSNNGSSNGYPSGSNKSQGQELKQSHVQQGQSQQGQSQQGQNQQQGRQQRPLAPKPQTKSSSLSGFVQTLPKSWSALPGSSSPPSESPKGVSPSGSAQFQLDVQEKLSLVINDIAELRKANELLLTHFGIKESKRRRQGDPAQEEPTDTCYKKPRAGEAPEDDEELQDTE